ncbi:precorrin-6y C5,15-methyltransferase (decarboxylating) subunit CbiE, partial [Streptomyces sp. NPDC002044]|uniref:precorrin-6y C5,15-methyltransferase (decarboxylating) subunit CbiE n=1 Tax=Streptomyces sp. NPDC002044 TaxID=3154662 RepID=UPI0033277638
MSSVPPPSPVTVVGLGADGWAGLTAVARSALGSADVLIGGPRQLDLLPAEACPGERVAWPSPLRPAVPKLMAEHAGRRVAVLASGDPMFYGIGRALAQELGPEALRIHPHPSSVSYACARLGWPVEDTEVVTVVGRPVARLASALYEGRRVLVLSAGAGSPGEIAALLRERGFGPSRMRVLEQLGSEREDAYEGVADGWEHPAREPLNVVAVDCRRDAAHAGPRLGATP